MSYLHTPTIIFSGDFQADVSTVNNDVRHYDNKTFEKRFQQHSQPAQGPDGKPSEIQNGGWNPNGGSTFSLINCRVQHCIGLQEADDSLTGAIVSGPIDRPGGKMVDLDPQMQFTSELWAVRIRIADKENNLLLEGDLSVTGFRDAQQRQFPTSQDDKSYAVNAQPIGSCWVSTLTNIHWGASSAKYQLLSDLKNTTEENRLSISLSAFGYFYTHLQGRFSIGRIIGVIGPWKKTEPVRFAATRRVYGVNGGLLEYSNFIVDEDQLTIDTGMSYPVCDPLGTPHPGFKTMIVAASKSQAVNSPLGGATPIALQPDSFEVIGSIDTGDNPDWLLKTGGILQYKLTNGQQQLLKNNQLLFLREKDGQYLLYGREGVDGWFMRCDQNVLRIDPGNTLTSDLYVYQWGQPVRDIVITIQMQPRRRGSGGSSRDPDPPKAAIPFINFPSESIGISAFDKTDEYGKTSVAFTGSDPGNPREYLDGQIYILKYALQDHPSLESYSNDTIMIHLRDAFSVPDQPAWSDVKDTWLQFGNLYPVMSKHIVDMSVAEEILKRKDILLFAFTRDVNDPLYMPVTRDLSANKMAVLIKWLENPSMLVRTTKKKPEAAFKELVTVEEAVPAITEEDHLSKAGRAKAGDREGLAAFLKHTPMELL